MISLSQGFLAIAWNVNVLPLTKLQSLVLSRNRISTVSEASSFSREEVGMGTYICPPVLNAEIGSQLEPMSASRLPLTSSIPPIGGILIISHGTVLLASAALSVCTL